MMCWGPLYWGCLLVYPGDCAIFCAVLLPTGWLFLFIRCPSSEVCYWCPTAVRCVQPPRLRRRFCRSFLVDQAFTNVRFVPAEALLISCFP